MLSRGRGPSKPTIIGNVHEQLRTVQREAAHFRRENRFVADKDAETSAGHLPNTRYRAGREVRNIRSQPAGERQPAAERNVLTERHQVNFVIGKNALAMRIE